MTLLYSLPSTIACAALLLASALPAAAQDAEVVPSKKMEYHFAQPTTPDGVRLVNNAPFSYSGNQAKTCRGVVLATYGQKILDFQVSPTAANYALVSADKKENKSAVFSTIDADQQILQFKNKKLGGNPTAAVYTPDARKLIIAAGGNLNVFETRKFTQVDTLPIDLTPTRMLMSHNGYFIAMDDGHNVVIYNLDQKKPRTRYKFEDDVTAVRFNADDSELAILTQEGDLTLYDTRTFMPKKTLDDLGGGYGLDYNADGKYLLVATSPEKIEIFNLLNMSDHDFIDVPTGEVSSLHMISDMEQDALVLYPSASALKIKRLTRLSPYYGKLISEEANERLNEWLKMMPGETMEQYQNRVNDESRRKMLQTYEDELATQYAGDLVSMASVSLGKYDRGSQLLEVDFDNMPSIFLPVPETSLGGFTNASDLEFRNARYGVMGDDNFELIYAEVYNRANGESYIYDNVDRIPLSFMDGDDNVVSIEIIQQQQMEELRLQEIKRSVIEEAKSNNIISDHTNITVDSRVDPAYDSEGNKILNYTVKFTYEVDPQFTASEDFAPGKYHVEESGAASSMLRIVKEAFEGDFAPYLEQGKKLIVKISGTADATPIVSTIKYDGTYGEMENEPVYKNGQMSAITVTTKAPVTENEQLAFLRALGVQHHLQNNVQRINDMNVDFQHHIGVSTDKGSQFRRITAEFTFVDAL